MLCLIQKFKIGLALQAENTGLYSKAVMLINKQVQQVQG